LNEAALKGLMDVAASLDLDCLVEIHTEVELQRACNAGAGIIGINNRDLSTFTVDMGTCERLIRKVPKGKVIVAESGYKHYQEIQQLENSGVHAVLIGETFMQEHNIGHKIQEVMYGQN
jgi:indole-3-glycerol phosphate synthase